MIDGRPSRLTPLVSISVSERCGRFGGASTEVDSRSSWTGRTSAGFERAALGESGEDSTAPHDPHGAIGGKWLRSEPHWGQTHTVLF